MYSDNVCTSLLGESTITDLISQYSNSPAIFNFEPAPLDSTGLIITVVDSFTGVQDTRLSDGGNIELTIKIWGNKSYDLSSLYNVADVVRNFLHRKTDYTLDVGEVIMGKCGLPQFTTVGDYPLALMQLNLKVMDI